MKTINELTENTLVTDGKEYARVKYCIHNNPYYAFIGSASEAERMDYTEAEIEAAERVSDWDEANVSECCG